MVPRVAGLALLLVLALAAGAVSADGASAHADLLRAEPAADAEMRESPSTLTLYFSQGLKRDGSFVLIEAPSGGRVPVQVSFEDADDKVMKAAIQQDLTPGVYTVRWQTLSADDDDYHDGTYSLTVLNLDGSEPDGAGGAADAGNGNGGSDTVVLVLVTAAVVAMVGGLAVFIRRSARPAS